MFELIIKNKKIENARRGYCVKQTCFRTAEDLRRLSRPHLVIVHNPGWQDVEDGPVAVKLLLIIFGQSKAE